MSESPNMHSSEMEARHDSPGPKVSRKSHRKSRNGCLNCKRRRIKCNEEKPRCGNCIKHSDKCSFLTSNAALPNHTITTYTQRITPHSPGLNSSPSLSNDHQSPMPYTSTPEHQTKIHGIHHVLNITDLELLHNYTTSTAYTISNIAGLQTFFRTNIPQFAFQHSFVLHGILALSSLHLSHFKRDAQATLYKHEAKHHYEIALRAATSLLPSINETTTPPLYLFGTFCTLITLGLGPKPGDFLLFTDRGPAEWLTIFRGMQAILDTHYDLLRHGELAPMFQISIHQIFLQPANDEHLQDLKDLINTVPDASTPIYLSALESLSRSFPASTVSGSRATQTSPQIVFVWLYRLPEEFVGFLVERRPVPLVILAYFCVLLNDLSGFWWAKGWAVHLVSEIWGCLPEMYRVWMRWPMEEIGWLPG